MSKSSDNFTLDNLLQRNEKLTSRLFEVNERLKESEAFKSHFISNITNEILNPFSSILALSENIGQLEGSEMKQAKKMAALIHQEAFHLDFQLKNIFAAAAIESGLDELLPVSVDLCMMVEQVIHFFRHEINARQLEVDFQVKDVQQLARLKSFRTDEEHLELILKNLVNNAVKFSPKNGKINIRMEMDEKMFRFSIRDFGTGISKEKYHVIFDRFKQLETSIQSRNSGHGLGLSVVNAHVQLFEGKIELENPEGGGLEIRITIPELDFLDDRGTLDDFLFNTGERF